MNCPDVVELVTEHREGGLTVTQRIRYEHHVAGCEHCQGYIESFEITVRSLDALPAEPADPEVRERLLVLFREQRGG